MLAGSRALVWAASMVAVRLAGVAREAAVPGRSVAPVQGHSLGALLQSPVTRWDGVWYLTIAAHGYGLHDGLIPPPRTNFFPLYPLLVAVLRAVGVPLVAGAVVVSLLAAFVALYLLARLVELELEGRAGSASVARVAMLAVAVSPVAFFLSSAYPESLYLALTVAALLAARRGRWALAGLAAGLASATHGPGVLIVVALLVLYVSGPRDGRASDRDPEGASERTSARQRLAPDVLWLGLAPLGLVGYMVYLRVEGASPFSFVRSQHLEWGHVLTWPWVTIGNAVSLALAELHALLDGRLHATLLGTFPHAAIDIGWEQLLPLAALLVAVPAIVGVWRRLPRAYGVYVVLALLINLATPVVGEPLQGLPRYLLVLFPLFVWFALATERHPRLRWGLLGASAALLAVLSATFATGHFVA